MNASVVDLRYRMKDVLRALDRREDVSILYHGKVKGVIRARAAASDKKMTDHPFFNMSAGGGTVAEEMKVLRGGRFRAV